MFTLLGRVELWRGKIIPLPLYGTSEGWVRAHTGGTLNGILVIVIALVLPKLRLGAFMQRFTAYGFVYIAWSFTVFYWLGNASSNRASSMGDSPLGEADTIRPHRIFARRAERYFSYRIVGGCREGCIVFRSRLAVPPSTSVHQATPIYWNSASGAQPAQQTTGV